MSIEAQLGSEIITVTGIKPWMIQTDGTVNLSYVEAGELADQLQECRRNSGGRESVVVAADGIMLGDIIENFGEVLDFNVWLGHAFVKTDQDVNFAFQQNYLITVNRRIQ